MSEPSEKHATTRVGREPDEDMVAPAAERLLAAADRAASDIREAERHKPEDSPVAGPPEAVRGKAEHASAHPGDVDPTAGQRDAGDAQSEEAVIAEMQGELDSVQAELNEVSSGIIGLQAHSLRQTGVAALVLAVLIAVAWKVLGG
jgi:hypothetical protein